MKKTIQLKAAALFAFAMLFSAVTFAQTKPVPSPRDSVSATVKGATISINYGSPSVKGRKIYGELVPYNKGWRAGANKATTFTTSADIQVGGKKLAAGTYSLYMVPGEAEWKVVFNSAIPSWGIGAGGVANDPTKDLFSVNVKAKKAGPTEKLRYEVRPNGIALVWENVEVFVPAK